MYISITLVEFSNASYSEDLLADLRALYLIRISLEKFGSIATHEYLTSLPTLNFHVSYALPQLVFVFKVILSKAVLLARKNSDPAPKHASARICAKVSRRSARVKDVILSPGIITSK